jgi:hypothetical protein
MSDLTLLSWHSNCLLNWVIFFKVHSKKLVTEFLSPRFREGGKEPNHRTARMPVLYNTVH